MNQKIFSNNSNLTVVTLLIALIPLVLFETTLGMADVWISNETFTHGFLIFPISLWLIWQKRDALRAIEPVSEPRVLILIMPLLALWFVSRMVDVQVMQQLTMLTLIPLLIWLVLGRWVLLALLFPVLYLFFAVPLGQGLIPPMMEFTADFTVALIRLSGIPVFRDGLFFSLPSGDWSVVEECSGVRYLIASLALGTIYAYITYQSYLKRSVFILMAILVPIIANGLRAFGIVMLGHGSGMTIAVGADHLLYGWVFFGIIIFAMFYIGNFWADAPASPASDAETRHTESAESSNAGIQPMLIVLPFALFIVTSAFTWYLANRDLSAPQDIDYTLAENFEGWQFDENLGLGWRPEISNADAQASRTYRFGNEIVQANVAVFLYQRHGAEAISWINRLTDPYNGAWKITFATDRQDDDLFVRESELRRSSRKILVWSWYRIGQMETPNRYIGKFLEAYHRVFTTRTDIAIISIATPLRDDKAAAQDRLRDFWRTAATDINIGVDALVQSYRPGAD